MNEFILSFDMYRDTSKFYKEFSFNYRDGFLLNEFNIIYTMGYAILKGYTQDLEFVDKNAKASRIHDLFLPFDHIENVEIKDNIFVTYTQPIYYMPIINIDKLYKNINIKQNNIYLNYFRFNNKSKNNYFILNNLENNLLLKYRQEYYDMSIFNSYFMLDRIKDDKLAMFTPSFIYGRRIYSNDLKYINKWLVYDIINNDILNLFNEQINIRHDKYLNEFNDQIQGQAHIKISNIFQTINMHHDIFKLIKNEFYSLKRRFYDLDSNKQILLNPLDIKKANKINLSALFNNKYADYNKHFFGLVHDRKYLNNFKQVPTLYKRLKNSYVNFNFNINKPNNKNFNYASPDKNDMTFYKVYPNGLYLNFTASYVDNADRRNSLGELYLYHVDLESSGINNKYLMYTNNIINLSEEKYKYLKLNETYFLSGDNNLLNNFILFNLKQNKTNKINLNNNNFNLFYFNKNIYVKDFINLKNNIILHTNLYKYNSLIKYNKSIINYNSFFPIDFSFYNKKFKIWEQPNYHINKFRIFARDIYDKTVFFPIDKLITKGKYIQQAFWTYSYDKPLAYHDQIKRIDSSYKSFKRIPTFELISSFNKSIIRLNIELENNIVRNNKDMTYIMSKETIDKYYPNLYLNNNLLFVPKTIKEIKELSSYIDIIKQLLPIMNSEDKDDVNGIIFINKMDSRIFKQDILDLIKQKYGAKELIKNIISTKLELKDFDLFSQTNFICDKIAYNTNFVNILELSVFKKAFKVFKTDNVFVYKVSKNTYINNFIKEIFLYKVPYSVSLNKNLFLNRLEYDVLNDNCITILFKSALGIHQDKSISVYKKQKDIAVYNNYFIQKSSYMLNTFFSEEWLSKSKHVFLFQSQQMLDKKNVSIDILNNLSVNKESYNAYFENTNIFGQPIKEISDNNSGLSAELIKKINIANKEINIRKIQNLSIYDNLFINKQQYLFEIIPELKEIDKVAKDINLDLNSTTEWAWTYEEDEGFDDPFTIDELLLPEHDSRYEDFENIIFDRDIGEPRNPVEVIDKYHFIAKLPNHYPIKDENDNNAYENVAIEYLDVRTNIMRKVFIGFYQLWQNHIFEFSRMTITQSAKTILDYLYTWILMKFPEEDIPEALRTFRLVRWYIERSIIECSEYLIEYEPDDLTSGTFSTTKLDIPNDMQPEDPDTPPNNTMYIDTRLHVLRNNPAKLGSDTYITFYIDNYKDTSISFSLHTTSLTSIILNGEEIDNITLLTKSKLVYNIPYTGHVNEFQIKKLGKYNTGNLFIGNIVIPGMGKNGNLNIDFNPKIQGNRMLNNVSEKIFSYINLYEDNNDIIQDLLKGNIHLDEAYNKMLKYWDLHHQDKYKGKRLTIKRT